MSIENHIEEYLVAYLDGELSTTDHARVEAHLTTCDRCRLALKELQALRQDIDVTIDTALSSVKLSYEADDRIRQHLRARLERRPVWWQALWLRRGFIGQAIMAVFVVFISTMTIRVMVPGVAVPVHETTVLGQDRFAPGSQGALRVVVQSLGSALPSAIPVSGAKVVVSLAHASGAVQRLYSGKTDTSGSAAVTFTIPDDVEGQAEIIVETSSEAGTEQIIRPIRIVRSHKIFLGSDKPAYRPGQTIYLRALALDAVTGYPADGETLSFEVLDGQARVISESIVNTSAYGIAYTEFELPSGVQLGSYTLRAIIGDTVVDRSIEVSQYPHPEFDITLETVETFVMPGESIHGSLESTYFFGKPVQGSVKILAFSDEDTVLMEQTGILDKQGIYSFQIDLPHEYSGNAVTIVGSVLDTAGQIEGIQHILPVSTTPFLIKAIPESGLLKPGVENVIYITTVYPDGLPVRADLILTVDKQQTAIKTDAFGMAVYHFTPKTTTNLHVQAQDENSNKTEIDIPLTAEEHSKSLLLRAERAAYRVGETVDLEVFVAADDVATVFLDVIRNGQMVAVLSASVSDGHAVFAIDLDTTLSGALNLRAYAVKDGEVSIEDSRSVVVDPAGSLNIAVSADKQTYTPGDMAHLNLTTTMPDQSGKDISVQSVLGIAVVDTSVLSLDRLPAGFARTYFLLDRALMDRQGAIQGFDPPALLEGEESTRQAQDLVARAAWAGVKNITYTTPSSVLIEGTDYGLARRTQLARRLSWLLILLPVGVAVVIVRGLIPTGVFLRACAKLGWGLLAVTVLSPVLIVGVILGLLLPWLGVVWVAGLSFIVLVLLGVLLILSWMHHDTRMQLSIVMVGVYVIVAACTLILSAISGSSVLQGIIVSIITVMFLLLLLSLFVLAQGLILEGRRLDGWLLSSFVVLLIFLVVSLPGIPRLRSQLSQTISNPLLYTGPLGWFTGCSVAYEPEATEAPSSEKETEVEATQMPPAPTASPMPTAQPPGTATPVTVPLEPYPFRQIFPETLYWAPEIETSAGGAIDLDIKMADSLTTWRLTALGSTKQGLIGAATYDILVFQDFFVDVQTPVDVKMDQSSVIGLSVYNYLDSPQTVKWYIVPSEDFTITSPPQALVIEPNALASTTIELVPQRTGQLTLQIAAQGDMMTDRLQIVLEVNAQ